MPALVIGYIILAFAGGSLTTSWIGHNKSVKEHRAMATIDADMRELADRMSSPECDERCRIKTDKEYRKLAKYKAELDKKYDTTGSKGLAMVTEVK